MKNPIFISIAENLIARNIFFTPFWQNFLNQNKDRKIILLVQPDREAFFKNIFTEPNVVVVPYRRQTTSSLEAIIMSLARSAINSHTNLWSKMRSYERGDSSLTATIFKRCHAAMLGGFNFYKKFLRRLILQVCHDRHAAELFAQYQPAAFISTSLTNFDFDVPLAAEAKRRKIFLIGLTRSWDNLSSHGLLRVVPDVLLLQNNFLKEMGYRYQALDSNKLLIEIIGLPHYDWYKKTGFIEPRQQFIKKNNLDPNKKIILWCTMGEQMLPKEWEFGWILDQLIDQKKIDQPAQILLSEHPKYRIPVEKTKTMKHLRQCLLLSYASESADSWQKELAHIGNLMNLIYHADVLVIGASTMAIDAACFDKPIICLGFDGLTGPVSHWHSIERFYDCYTHYEELMKCNGIRLAKNSDQLALFINGYLKDPSLDKAGRQAIVQKFVGPFTGNDSQRLAGIISYYLNKPLRQSCLPTSKLRE